MPHSHVLNGWHLHFSPIKYFTLHMCVMMKTENSQEKAKNPPEVTIKANKDLWERTRGVLLLT